MGLTAGDYWFRVCITFFWGGLTAWRIDRGEWGWVAINVVLCFGLAYWHWQEVTA